MEQVEVAKVDIGACRRVSLVEFYFHRARRSFIRRVDYPWNMGKTVPTYRDHLQSFENDWKAFRRGLLREYQEHWDEVVVQAHQ